MPLKMRGSVSARLSVWFSRVSAARERRERRVEHLEPAGIDARRAPPRPGRRAATPAASSRPRSGAACPSGSRTPPARPCPGRCRARARASCSRPGDHQVHDQEELALELEDDALAQAPQARRRAGPRARRHRADRPSAAGTGSPTRSALERLPDDARRQRFDVDGDVGELGHDPLRRAPGGHRRLSRMISCEARVKRMVPVLLVSVLTGALPPSPPWQSPS